MLKNILVISMMTLAWPALASTQNVKVMGQEVIQGQKKVRLKAMANQQLKSMGENPENYTLKAVTLVAHSRGGEGSATLIVGGDRNKKMIPGGRKKNKGGINVIIRPGADNPFDITIGKGDKKLKYHRLTWDISHAQGQSNERWQMHLDGRRISVRSLTLTLQSSKKRIVIPIRKDKIFTKRSMIKLRERLAGMDVNFKGKKLRQVILFAKSKAGNGSAFLQVGQNDSADKPVVQAANGYGFKSSHKDSYNRISFKMRGNTRKGPWRIHMKGRIKVHRVVVVLE